MRDPERIPRAPGFAGGVSVCADWNVHRTGRGKSTLLRILAGILKADGGSLLWRGEDLLCRPETHRSTVGYVPQDTPLFEELSALDNLRLWYSKQDLQTELSDGLLAALGIGDFLRVRVSHLSGGMKKRLTVGCAMARHPSLLLLDEPSTALDFASKAELLDYFRMLRGNGATLLLATHDFQEIAVCDRVFMLKDGKLSELDCVGDAAQIAAELNGSCGII